MKGPQADAHQIGSEKSQGSCTPASKSTTEKEDKVRGDSKAQGCGIVRISTFALNENRSQVHRKIFLDRIFQSTVLKEANNAHSSEDHSNSYKTLYFFGPG